MGVLILYNSNINKYEVMRLKKESKRYVNIKFLDVMKLDIPFDLELFRDYKVVFFYTRTLGRDSYILASELEGIGKIVINKNFGVFQHLDKTLMYMILSKHGVRIPKFVKIYNIKSIRGVLKLGFPLVVKHVSKHRGTHVRLIKSKEELKTFVRNAKRKISSYLFQEYIDYNYDLRVIFIGNNVVGVMKRVSSGDFRANISRGGVGSCFEIDNKIKEITMLVARSLKMQVGSIDILIDKNGNYYVIDAHNIFQFKGFERYTKINVANEIIKYLKSLI